MMSENTNIKLIDKLLGEWSSGNKAVENKLMELLYPYIHKIAHFQIKSNHANALQTTEVVNEAFIKLQQQKSFNWKNKAHFLAITSKVIRRVLIDHYREETCQKRGGQEQAMTLDRFENIIEEPLSFGAEWLNIHCLLNQLHLFDPNAALVVEYKVFGGLTIPEMAQAMSVSESTILRNWNFAKSWVIRQYNK